MPSSSSTSLGTVFTLQVNSDGSWSFDLDDQLDHIAGKGENLDLRTNCLWPASRSVRSTSHRSSSRLMPTATPSKSCFPATLPLLFAITFPPVSESRFFATVLEDGLSLAGGDSTEGNRENGESVSSDEVSGAPGALIGRRSARGRRAVNFQPDPRPAHCRHCSHRRTVNYQIVGNTLTASTPSFGQVFTLTVNIDGSWSFDLTGQLDHVDNGLNG